MPERTVIVLDPGHSDWTHEFPGGYREGRLVRLAAIEAEKLLEAEGHRVVLTRTTSGDDPSLTYRGTLAVREGARVFVSLHTDAASDAAARGVHAIFYATSKSDASAPDHQIAAPNGRALARAIAQEVASSLGLPLRSASTALHALVGDVEARSRQSTDGMEKNAEERVRRHGEALPSRNDLAGAYFPCP